MEIRNRVKELILVRSGDLLDHEGNWRIHPKFQTEALRGSLEEVGITDVLKAYYSKRNGGKLTLLDGHARKADNPEQVWPVIVLDVDDIEADKQLAFHDTISSWAQPDALKLNTLIEQANIRNERLRAASDRVLASIQEQVDIARKAQDSRQEESKKREAEVKERRDMMVRIIIDAGESLAIVEQALRATGISSRGKALAEMARFYIDNVTVDDVGNKESAG